jgi:hypothetical protein
MTDDPSASGQPEDQGVPVPPAFAPPELGALDAELARRRRVVRYVAALGVLGVVAAVVVVVAINSGGSSTKSAPIANNRANPASPVLGPVTSVPVQTLDAVGLGSIEALPKAVTGTPLTADGKPELLFIGAEFCPYCAGERWSMAVALSRFGTLHGVTTTESSSTDVDPDTHSLDFVGATYDSKYLSFVPVEAEDRNEQPLVRPSAAQTKLWDHYSNNQPGFPFLDFGNAYIALGPTFDPAVLAGLDQQQIAAKLINPADPVSRAVDGAANVLTATICELTQNQPGSVCGDSMITGLESRIDGSAAT